MTPHLYTNLMLHHPDAAFERAGATGFGNNSGNLVFAHAIDRIFGTEGRRIARGGDTSALSPETDCLVLPLANNLGAHERRSAGEFARVHVPMVAVGLGAQGPATGVDADAIPESTWEWLRAIVARRPRADAPNVALRGEMTRSLVASRGLDAHCVVTGCPSNFINPSPTLGRELHRRRANGLRRIAVAAGNPLNPQHRRLEQSLLAMVEQTQGLYVCQAPLDVLRLVNQEYEDIPRERFLSVRDHLLPGRDDDAVLEWFRRHAYAFRSVPEWLAMLSRFDLVVGARIHGVMAGLQAGVPSLCLCIDARMIELCETMALPHVDAREFRQGISREQIGDLLRQWDWRAFDDTRRALAERLAGFARGNGLRAEGPLKGILGGSGSHGVPRAADASTHQRQGDSAEDRYPEIFRALERAVDGQVGRVLSFGCSDGFEPNDLASKHFLHAQVVGCDVNDDAIRIARLANRLPSRVRIERFDRDALGARPPFDAIVAMSVLCRWPESRDVDDLAALYPFEAFDELVGFLVSRLRPGGVLCVYNANYRVMQTSVAAALEPLAVPAVDTQAVRIFERDGRPEASQKLDAVLFRKRDASDQGAA